MAAVRLGERVLVIGAGEPKMLAAVAAKSGLTGHAAAVVSSEEEASRLSSAAAGAGILLEVEVAPGCLGLPTTEVPFDVAVIDGAVVGGDAGGDAPTACLRWVYASLRPGGRAVVVERRQRGLTALLGRRRSDSGKGDSPASVVGRLEAAGFRPVRVLADRGGWAFTEGLRGR